MKNRREIDHARSGINRSFEDAAQRIETALAEEAPEVVEALQSQIAEVQPTAPAALAVGVTVRIPKWKSMGTVLELTGKTAKVAMGSIQMSLSIKDIEPLNASEAAQLAKNAPKPKAKAQQESGSYAPPGEIDLRGKRLDEAMSELESYIDLAYRSGSLAEITIVHGLGTGAIREATRKLLKRLPYVKSYNDGGVGRGGAGATVVEFER